MTFEFKKAVKKGACLKRAKKLLGAAEVSIGVTAGAVLRNILYQAALVMMAKSKEMKLLHHYLTDRKENPLCKKQALVVITIKIIKIVLTLVNKGQMYEAEKVLGDYRTAQMKAA